MRTLGEGRARERTHAHCVCHRSLGACDTNKVQTRTSARCHTHNPAWLALPHSTLLVKPFVGGETGAREGGWVMAAFKSEVAALCSRLARKEFLHWRRRRRHGGLCEPLGVNRPMQQGWKDPPFRLVSSHTCGFLRHSSCGLCRASVLLQLGPEPPPTPQPTPGVTCAALANGVAGGSCARAKRPVFDAHAH